MVKVVELTNHREPRQCHFGISGPGQGEVLLRGDPVRHRVHHFSPRPEVALALLRSAAPGAVKSVGVGIGEAGEHQPRQVPGAGDPPLIDTDRFDGRAINSQSHVGVDGGPAEPGVVAKVLSERDSGGRGVRRGLAGGGGAGRLYVHSSSPVISSTASEGDRSAPAGWPTGALGPRSGKGTGQEPIGAAHRWPRPSPAGPQ